MNTDRIANQICALDTFDTILQMNETHIPEYIEKHSEFIKSNPPGYGRWIWKPKIILDTLFKMSAKKSHIVMVSISLGTNEFTHNNILKHISENQEKLEFLNDAFNTIAK
jgi:hypothetical protein